MADGIVAASADASKDRSSLISVSCMTGDGSPDPRKACFYILQPPKIVRMGTLAAFPPMPRSLGQLRGQVCIRRYSIYTGQGYVALFILWHGKRHGHKHVQTTMTYTQVLNCEGRGVPSLRDRA